MHLNPYGEYAVLLAASLANEWPADRAGIVARARDHGMTMAFAEMADDHVRTRGVIDEVSEGVWGRLFTLCGTAAESG